jgi:peptide deformylase
MIVQFDNNLLHQKSTDASLEEATAIIELLEKELSASEQNGRPGIGLAAIQIGIPKNIAIVRINDILKVNLVNAKISKSYDKTIFKDEGCLSYPGIVKDTMRYQEIYIENNLVYPYSFTATGLFAVCIQHELDHMNGIVIEDIGLKKTKIKVRPNDPCSCGKVNKITGLKVKYKNCCGA